MPLNVDLSTPLTATSARSRDLVRRLGLGVAAPALLSGLVGAAALTYATEAAAQSAATAPAVVPPPSAGGPPPGVNTQGRVIRSGRLNTSLRRETHPPRAPESSQGQVTNANASAPNAGIFPFIPPYFTKLPGAGLSIDTKGIGYATDDKDMQFRIGGRYQEDFSAASTSPRIFSRTTPLINAGTDGIDSRRAYFESYLTLKNGVSVAFQYDFANVAQPIQDGVVSYHAPDTHVIYTIGNFKEPFSLNQLISDNVTTFTERGLQDGLSPARNFGGAIATYGDKWTATGGIYAGNANNTLTDFGVGGAARVTYAPILEKTQLLHFGVAGAYRSLDDTLNPAAFSTRPDDSLERALITTGALRNSDSIGRVNFEAIYQFASFRVQGEYTFVDVGGKNGQRDRSFQGGYIEGAWVINGAGRPYRVSAPYGSEMAVLQGVQVEDPQRISNGGYGVFEVAARFDALDLQRDGVTGGSQHNVEAGLNWYPDRNIRFMADYIHSFIEPAARSILGNNVPQRNFDGDAVVGRAQLFW